MYNSLVKLLFAVTLVLPLFAQSELVVDRGLPKINLNNNSGSARSNVRWGDTEERFLGDDFTIGAPGERWVIDAIRTWTVPGTAAHHPERLGDAFQDVRLYIGSAKKDLTPVAAGAFTEGSDANDNPSIVASEATQDGVITYDDFGARGCDYATPSVFGSDDNGHGAEWGLACRNVNLGVSLAGQARMPDVAHQTDDLAPGGWAIVH